MRQVCNEVYVLAFCRAAGCDYFVLNAICEVGDEAEQIEMMVRGILPKFPARAAR